MTVDLKVFRSEILRYTLVNAVRYGGRAKVQPVLSKFLGEHGELRGRVREIISLVEEVVEEVNRLSLADQKRMLEEMFPEASEERREEKKLELPPLPNVDKYGVVTTRYAPNPDFVLHFGQARAIYLSHDYARMYKGKFILRFEDTDPRTKKPRLEFYDAIREDIRWLGCRWDEEYIQSLRLETYYEVAGKLVESGGAYVCTCSRREFRGYISASKPCPCRGLTVEEHRERLERMLEGVYGEGEAVLRVKTDLAHPNPSIREWVALRIIDTEKHPHPIVGDRYRVWPTYNFAAGIDDHLMGVTHIIRGKEFIPSMERQLYMYKWLGWSYPECIHYGKWMVKGRGVMSKSRMLKELELGVYKSWDDPRLPTLAALRRRGIQPEAIHRMVLEVGVKSSEASFSWENLYAYNRKIVDPKARRFFYVEEPVELRVRGVSRSFEAKIPFHPSRSEAGFRRIKVEPDRGEVKFYISRRDLKFLLPGGIVRLIGLFNFKPLEVSEEFVEAVFYSEPYEDASKAGAKLIHWVPVEGRVDVEVVMPDAALSKGYGEPLCRTVEVGEVVQFERFGFARFDGARDRNVLVFYYAHR